MNTSKRTRLLQGLSILLMLTVVLFGAVPAVQASEIDGDGIVEAGETINDDLFLSEETVQMDGTVNGILFATGNTVTINGEVNGDIIVAGQIVEITENARIDGNVFTGAQNIIMNGEITGSLFAGGASLTTGKTSSVARNLYFGGYSYLQAAGSKIGRDTRAGLYQASLKGETGRDAVVFGGAVEVDGKIGRNANFMVEDPGTEMDVSSPFMANMGVTTRLKPGLRVSPAASIGGQLTYTSKADQSSAIKSAPVGGIVFQTPMPEPIKNEKPEIETKGFLALDVLSRVKNFASNLISLFLVGLLILWKAPSLLQKTVEMVQSKPWNSLGMGFVTILVGYAGAGLAFFVVILVGVIIGFISFGGLAGPTISLGLALLAAAFVIFSIAVTLVSKVIIAYLIGRWIYSKLAVNGTSTIWPLVIGVLVYAILRAIPFIGLLIGIIATLLGVGAMWLMFRKMTKPEVAEI